MELSLSAVAATCVCHTRWRPLPGSLYSPVRPLDRPFSQGQFRCQCALSNFEAASSPSHLKVTTPLAPPTRTRSDQGLPNFALPFSLPLPPRPEPESNPSFSSSCSSVPPHREPLCTSPGCIDRLDLTWLDSTRLVVNVPLSSTPTTARPSFLFFILSFRSFDLAIAAILSPNPTTGLVHDPYIDPNEHHRPSE